MKNKHYTNEELLKMMELSSLGKTQIDIAKILNREGSRVSRKLNELGLYKFKKITQYTKLKILKVISSDKLEYYNNKLNSYFNKKENVC